MNTDTVADRNYILPSTVSNVGLGPGAGANAKPLLGLSLQESVFRNFLDSG